MSSVLFIFLGISLSAASGFRIFVPPLVLSVMAQTTSLDLPTNLTWMDSPVAVAVFGAATVAEVLAFYIPWVDNLLDTLATPAAVIAGTLMTFSFGGDLEPALRWSLALIAGGGAAGGVQSLTAVTRLGSTATTGGLANPVIATGENIASTTLSVLAIFFPLFAFLAVIALLGFSRTAYSQMAPTPQASALASNIYS